MVLFMAVCWRKTNGVVGVETQLTCKSVANFMQKLYILYGFESYGRLLIAGEYYE